MSKSNALRSMILLLACAIITGCADLPANDSGWLCSASKRDGAIEATATIFVDLKYRQYPADTSWRAQIVGKDATVELSESRSLPKSMTSPAGPISLTFSIPSLARSGKAVSLPIEIRFSDGQPIVRRTVVFSEHWQQGTFVRDKPFFDNRGGQILIVALNSAGFPVRSVNIDPTIISRGRGLVPFSEAQAKALAQDPRNLCGRADAASQILALVALPPREERS